MRGKVMRKKIINWILGVGIMLCLAGCNTNRNYIVTIVPIENKEFFENEKKEAVLIWNYQYPQVEIEINKVAEAAINLVYNELHGKEQSLVEQYVEEAKTEGVVSHFAPWEYTTTFEQGCNNGHILSFLISHYQFKGGTNGIETVEGFTFDLDEGKQIALSDVMKNSLVFEQYATSEIKKQISMDTDIQDVLFSDWEDTVDRTFAAGEVATWYIQEDGIHVIYNEITVAAHFMGTLEYILPMKDCYQYMNSNYNEKFR